jgi:hypothetical protein
MCTRERRPDIRNGKCLKKAIFTVLLLLLPAFFPGAQQSFFIAPETEIKNGGLTRGFCLERNQPVLTGGNIGNLTRVSGPVNITYTDGTVRPEDFGVLLQTGRIRIEALDSAQYVRVYADDKNIEKLTVAEGGVTMYRQGISGKDRELAEANAEILRQMVKSGAPHQVMQEVVWRNHVPTFTLNKEAKTVTIDYHTSPEGKELRGRYGDDAAVIYNRQTETFRFDGLEHDPGVRVRALYDFITHLHGDHANYGALEEMYRNGLTSTVMYPMPLLESSMRKKAFETLQSIAKANGYEFDVKNLMYEIAPSEEALNHPVLNSTMGQFIYSKFRYGGFTLETFRHINPRDKTWTALFTGLPIKTCRSCSSATLTMKRPWRNCWNIPGKTREKGRR